MEAVSAIRELREAVEAGTWGADGVAEHPMALWDGTADTYPELGAAGFLAWNAYHGSLDAALALMNAVLPGWPVAIHDMTPEYLGAHGWMAKVNWTHIVWQPTFTASGPFAHEGRADTPARALLIAILKAMETQP